MDKPALNNQIVNMRKSVRKGRFFVATDLRKKIEQLKKRIEKAKSLGNEDLIQKLERKLTNREKEIKLLRAMKPDDVAKVALERQEPWTSVIIDPKASTTERLVARLASLETLQKSVREFRQAYPDCHEWIRPLLELWREKQALKQKKKVAKEKKKSKQENGPEETLPQHEPGNFSKTEHHPEEKSNKLLKKQKQMSNKGVIKKIKLDNSEAFDFLEKEPVTVNEEKDVNDKPKPKNAAFSNDDFFLAKGQAPQKPAFKRDLPDHPHDINSRHQHWQKPRHFQNKSNSFGPTSYAPKFPPRNNNWQERHQHNGHHMLSPKDKTNKQPTQTPEQTSVERLHPSWEAKRRERELMKAPKPANKVIKFT